VLDLCTGSACIAVACALAFPEAEVVASDIDDEVLQVAEINIKAHELDHRITLCQSDVFDGLDPDEQFDLIISNPPYVDDEDMQALPPEFRHEPGLALAAGENGLQVVEKIINGAHARLKDNGMLIVEVGNSADALLDAYPNLEFTWFEFEHGATPVFLLYKEQLQLDAHNDAGSKVVH
jgi:ribosomal protein L3 glutamine methyltransferase